MEATFLSFYVRHHVSLSPKQRLLEYLEDAKDNECSLALLLETLAKCGCAAEVTRGLHPQPREASLFRQPQLRVVIPDVEVFYLCLQHHIFAAGLPKMASQLPPDPYAELGVAKDAKLPEIRSAHRKLVLKNHPDKVRDDTSKSLAEKIDAFQKVQQAYELLSDDNRRLQYDEQVKLFELRKERGRLWPQPRSSHFTYEVRTTTEEERSRRRLHTYDEHAYSRLTRTEERRREERRSEERRDERQREERRREKRAEERRAEKIRATKSRYRDDEYFSSARMEERRKERRDRDELGPSSASVKEVAAERVSREIERIRDTYLILKEDTEYICRWWVYDTKPPLPANRAAPKKIENGL